MTTRGIARPTPSLDALLRRGEAADRQPERVAAPPPYHGDWTGDPAVDTLTLAGVPLAPSLNARHPERSHRVAPRRDAL